MFRYFRYFRWIFDRAGINVHPAGIICTQNNNTGTQNNSNGTQNNNARTSFNVHQPGASPRVHGAFSPLVTRPQNPVQSHDRAAHSGFGGADGDFERLRDLLEGHVAVLPE